MLINLSASNENKDFTIKMPFNVPLKYLHNFKYNDALPSYYIHFNIHSGLVDFNDSNQIVSALAESWEVLQNGLVYIFTLRSNIKWSNGQEITAQDVIFSLKRNLLSSGNNYLRKTLKNGYELKSLNQYFPSLSLIENNKIQIILNKPHHHFLRDLTKPEFAIVHSQSIDKNGYFKKNPITSGPYFVNSINEKELILEKNLFYFNTNKKAPQRIEFFLVKDIQELNNALNEGKIAFYQIHDRETKETLSQNNSKYNIIVGAYDNLMALLVRENGKNKDIIRFVMQVFSKYINKEKFIKTNEKIADKLVSMSELSPLTISRISLKEACALLNWKNYNFTLSISPQATKQQMEDTEEIIKQAKEIGIVIDKKFDTDLEQQYIKEKYEIALKVVGVYATDELALLNGYFCESYEPFLALKSLVCPIMNKALEARDNRQKKLSFLFDIYNTIQNSGYIISLYHFPRIFALRKDLEIVKFNKFHPYPRFINFRGVK
jgi:ABC-type transport system substrate-binding protein